MKVATEILIEATPEKIWNILMDFEKYPDWNRYFKAVRGKIAIDVLEKKNLYGNLNDTHFGTLEIDLQFSGKSIQKKIGEVTGYIAPKYFSWVWKHAWGNWFLSCEHVFRLKEKEGGRAIFFNESYMTGLGMRFRRRDMEHMLRYSMYKMNEDLKERAEAAEKNQV